MSQPIKYLHLDLNETRIRPVIMYGSNGDIPAMFDTGAVIPMFCFDEIVIKQGFHGEKTLSDVPLGGIGGDVRGSIYRIHDFHLDKMNFKTLDVFVPKIPPKDPHIVLSCTMLHGLSYGVDTKQHVFGISIQKESDFIRDFTLGLENGRLVTFLNGVQLTSVEQSESDFNYTQYLKKCEIRQHKFIEKVKRFIGELTGGHYR